MHTFAYMGNWGIANATHVLTMSLSARRAVTLTFCMPRAETLMDSKTGKKKKLPQIVSDDKDAAFFTLNQNTPAQFQDLPALPLDEFVIYPNALSVIKIRADFQSKPALQAMHEKEHLVAIALKDKVDFDNPPKLTSVDSFVPVGTYARIIKILKTEDEHGPLWQLTLRGEKRLRALALRYDDENGIYRMMLEPVEEVPLAIIGAAVYEDQTLLRSVRQSARNYFERCQQAPEVKDAIRLIEQVRDPGLIADFLSAQVDMPFKQHAQLLCTPEVRARLRILLDILANQLEVAKLVANAAQKVRADLDKQQRDYFIRQHIKALKDQISDEPENDNDEIKARIDKMDAPDDVVEYTRKQFKRFSYLGQATAEYAVARAHIETLLDIPWRKSTEDHLDLAEARRILDADHYGLEDVKDRIIEHLAVLALRGDLKSPILCLYGPPGVGKTSIGKSIARALGRKFERISLGGIHDESEIRGHRRTYVASMPGRIVQAIRHAQSMNPVLMLDEIDKLAHEIHGDPASALLEVLDPEQNNAFVDNYIEMPMDLSRVLFITTANSLDTIPGPLRDRMEIIEIHSYTHVDKRAIATEHLIPKVLEKHGLKKSNLALAPAALDDIISYYTREAGVRQLEQRLGALCRKVATRVVEGRESGKKSVRVSVTAKNLESFLGKRRYDYDTIEADRLPGISTGLAWTPVGGDILFIETTEMAGKGNLVITGKLGDVMQESVRAAMTLVRARAERLGLDPDMFEKRDIHVHVPAGATPKDGPSAGCAIFSALLSLFKGVSIPAELAMTGEISLRGNVLPVGGIREKVLAAHRAGIRTIILPAKNEPDLEDVHESVRNDIHFILVSTIDEVIDAVFGKTSEK